MLKMLWNEWWYRSFFQGGGHQVPPPPSRIGLTTVLGQRFGKIQRSTKVLGKRKKARELRSDMYRRNDISMSGHHCDYSVYIWKIPLWKIVHHLIRSQTWSKFELFEQELFSVCVWGGPTIITLFTMILNLCWSPVPPVLPKLIKLLCNSGRMKMKNTLSPYETCVCTQ